MEQWLVGVLHEVSFTITGWLVATCKGRWDNNGSFNNMSRTCCCMWLAWIPPPLRKATLDGWRYKHYFEFVEREENNLTKRCTLCPCWKLFFAAANTTSNSMKHPQAPTETACTHTKLVAKEAWSNMNVMSNVTSNVTNYFLLGEIM